MMPATAAVLLVKKRPCYLRRLLIVCLASFAEGG
jgi:hypothetical protein